MLLLKAPGRQGQSAASKGVFFVAGWFPPPPPKPPAHSPGQPSKSSPSPSLPASAAAKHKCLQVNVQACMCSVEGGCQPWHAKSVPAPCPNSPVQPTQSSPCPQTNPTCPSHATLMNAHTHAIARKERGQGEERKEGQGHEENAEQGDKK